MVQYHGLGLLYQIRKTDRLGVTKLVAKLTKMPLKSPYAACHLVCFCFLDDHFLIVLHEQHLMLSASTLDSYGLQTH